jgi:DNA ligase-1
MDGELLAWGEAGPKNFNTLQKRLGRRTVSKKLLQEAPVIFYAYDLLEWQSEDIRHKPLNIRRKMLEQLFKNPISGAPIKLSPTVEFDTWASLAKVQATARAEKAEGLMLKRKDGPYLACQT